MKTSEKTTWPLTTVKEIEFNNFLNTIPRPIGLSIENAEGVEKILIQHGKKITDIANVQVMQYNPDGGFSNNNCPYKTVILLKGFAPYDKAGIITKP